MLSHLFRRELDAIAMSREYPYEPIIDELADGMHEGTGTPDQPPRSIKRPCLWIPPEMIAGKEEPVVVEQCATSRCMTRHGNELKLRCQIDCFHAIHNPFRIRHHFRICTVDDARCAESVGVFCGIR